MMNRLERCIKDTCGCNVGGDCECMCTAVSAYAQVCIMLRIIVCVHIIHTF